MVTYHNLQTDLLRKRLICTLIFLKEVDDIEREELPGFLFYGAKFRFHA